MPLAHHGRPLRCARCGPVLRGVRGCLRPRKQLQRDELSREVARAACSLSRVAAEDHFRTCTRRHSRPARLRTTRRQSMSASNNAISFSARAGKRGRRACRAHEGTHDGAPVRTPLRSVCCGAGEPGSREDRAGTLPELPTSGRCRLISRRKSVATSACGRATAQAAVSGVLPLGRKRTKMSRDLSRIKVLMTHSKSLTPAQQNWPPLIQEAFAQLEVRRATRKVFGTIRTLCWTDHANLTRAQSSNIGSDQKLDLILRKSHDHVHNLVLKKDIYKLRVLYPPAT